MDTILPSADVQVNAEDIQGDSLVGFNKPYLMVMTFKIKEVNGTKEFLKKISPMLTSCEELLSFRKIYRTLLRKFDGDRVQVLNTASMACVNIGFSYSALKQLVPSHVSPVEAFATDSTPAFPLGLEKRAKFLGDCGEGDPSKWLPGLKDPDIIVQVASDTQALLDQYVNKIKGLSNAGIELVYEELGIRDPGEPDHGYQKEHFGFHDGIDNPAPRGYYISDHTKEPLSQRLIDPSCSIYNLYSKPGNALIQPGEIVLGYPTETQVSQLWEKGIDINKEHNLATTGGFIGPTWAKDGSFLVFRRFYQDVAAFWNFAKEAAEICNQGLPQGKQLDATAMAARFIGRWPSGAPLSLSPDKDCPALGHSKVWNDAFIYNNVLGGGDIKTIKESGRKGLPPIVTDPLGKRCPFGAHVRRIQPRDMPTDHGVARHTMERRIVRRGNPYGPRIADHFKDDGKDRGLLFIAYQSSIENQFEFLQQDWANPTDKPFANSGSIGNDIVIGQSPDQKRTFVVPLEDKEVTVTTNKPFVIPKGGGYFFIPAISIVRDLLTKPMQ